MSELKGEKLPAFEDYLMTNAGRFGEVALKVGARHGLIPERHALRDAPGGRWVKAEMTGLAAKIALTAANVWRRKHNLGKGKGTLSDIRQIIEAAHAAVFLTRDKDLVATYQLVREAVTDFRPIITLVPRP